MRTWRNSDALRLPWYVLVRNPFWTFLGHWNTWYDSRKYFYRRTRLIYGFLLTWSLPWLTDWLASSFVDDAFIDRLIDLMKTDSLIIIDRDVSQETQGVCVATVGDTADFPSFFSRKSGHQSPCHVPDVEKAAELIRRLFLFVFTLNLALTRIVYCGDTLKICRFRRSKTAQLTKRYPIRRAHSAGGRNSEWPCGGVAADGTGGSGVGGEVVAEMFFQTWNRFECSENSWV